MSNYHGNQMAAAQFTREMEYLAEHFAPISLIDLLSGATNDEKPVVAVTFDDGYENNYTLAYPILQRYRIPATIFLTAGYIGTDRILWTNVVERAFDATNVKRFDYAGGIEMQRYNTWFMRQKRAACRAIKHELKQLGPKQSDAKVDELLDVLKVKRNELDLAQYRIMTWEQARSMDPELIQFGSHTVNHCILTVVPERMARFEIEESKRIIETELGRPVQHFCYPNGNFNDSIVFLVRKVAYQTACTTVQGKNVGEFDPYRLQRMWGLDGTADSAFQTMLSEAR